MTKRHYFKRFKTYCIAWLLLELCIGFALYTNFHTTTARYFAQEIERIDLAYRAILNTYEQMARTVYDELRAAPAWKNMLMQAQTAEEETDAQFPPAFLKKLETRYWKLMEQHVNVLELHVADEKREEDRRPIRTSVAFVKAQQSSIRGFEITPSAMGFRYLFPFSWGEHRHGAVEIGISIDGVRQEMEHLFMREFLFLVKRDKLGQRADGSEFTESLLSPKYVRDTWNVFVHKSSATLEAIDAQLQKSIPQHLEKEQAYVEYTQVEEQDFLVTFLPIVDVEQDHAAFLVSYSKDVVVAQYRRDALMWMGISSLLLTGVVGLISLVRRNGALMRAQKKRHSSIFNAARDGFLILDQEGKIVDANPKACRMYGYAYQEFMGICDTTIVFEPIDFFAQFRAALHSEQEVEREAVHLKHDGTIFDVEVRGAVFELNGAEHLLVVARDITKRKQAEEELREMNRQLQEASQHKSDFLSRMSHELRTPLNAMIGFTSLTLNALRNRIASEYLTHLIKAEQSARMLLELINDILDFSKIEAGRMETFIEEIDLHEILEEAAIMAEGLLLHKPVEIRSEITGELPTIQSDYTKLKQILNNLVSNAIKFTDQGDVSIRAIPTPEEQHIRIEVADSGCGIPPEKLESIFESFKQVDGSIKKRYGGTGLGLAITKKLCSMLDIQIEVQSTPGEGTLFWLDIPAQFQHDAAKSEEEDRDADPVEEVEETGEAPEAESRTSILVVDDHELNLELLGDILERAGHTVFRALSGEDGIQSARQRQPDVVLMDLAMPGMDGVEATRELKRDPLTADIPVIACSAVVATNVRDQAFEAGCEGYIAKPVEPHYLVKQIAKYLAESPGVQKDHCDAL